MTPATPMTGVWGHWLHCSQAAVQWLRGLKTCKTTSGKLGQGNMDGPFAAATCLVVGGKHTKTGAACRHRMNMKGKRNDLQVGSCPALLLSAATDCLYPAAEGARGACANRPHMPIHLVPSRASPHRVLSQGRLDRILCKLEDWQLHGIRMVGTLYCSDCAGGAV